MDERFALAGKGLWYLFLSVVFTLAGTAVAIVPILGWIAAPILMLAALALQFMGPYVARNSHPNFQNAFYASIAAVLVGLVSGFFQGEGSLLAAVLNILGAIVSFLVTYFICTAAEALLAEVDGALADRARLIWKLYGGCMAVKILTDLMDGVPVLEWLAGIPWIISSIVCVVAYVMLIVFFYQSSRALRGQ